MSTPLGLHNVNELLSAFADGELDPAQNLAVLDYIETHREAFVYLRDRQRLRQSAQRIVLSNQHANTMPEPLKARLTQVADAEGRVPSGGARRSWRWWFLLATVVVSLAIGGAVGFYGHSLQHEAGGRASIALTDPATLDPIDVRDAAVPADLVRAATFVHVDCSRVAERLHAGGYPTAVGNLSDLVKADLGSPVAAPDLRPAGFHFVGAGPCAKPLESTVHLLYKADGDEPRQTVSVFAQTYHGQFGLTPGRLYHIRKGTIFPMIAWRTERVVYFLMADEKAAADKTIPLIPSAPKHPAV